LEEVFAPPAPAPVSPTPTPPQPPEVVPAPTPVAPPSGTEEVVWRGTVSQAENYFESKLVEQTDVVHVKETGKPFTGKFVILREDGSLKGEASLVAGRLHGDEIVYDNSGKILEQNLWENGELKQQ